MIVICRIFPRKIRFYALEMRRSSFSVQLQIIICLQFTDKIQFHFTKAGLNYYFILQAISKKIFLKFIGPIKDIHLKN